MVCLIRQHGPLLSEEIIALWVDVGLCVEEDLRDWAQAVE
jgi:hypothetical protein